MFSNQKYCMHFFFFHTCNISCTLCFDHPSNMRLERWLQINPELYFLGVKCTASWIISETVLCSVPRLLPVTTLYCSIAKPDCCSSSRAKDNKVCCETERKFISGNKQTTVILVKWLWLLSQLPSFKYKQNYITITQMLGNFNTESTIQLIWYKDTIRIVHFPAYCLWSPKRKSKAVLASTNIWRFVYNSNINIKTDGSNNMQWYFV